MSRDCPTLKTFSPTQRWGGFFVRFERTYYKRNKHVSANADPDFFKQPADLKASRRPKSCMGVAACVALDCYSW
jgi:hypothetical protein